MQKYDAELREINQFIWTNPELSYEEYKSHNRICAMSKSREAEGYKVRRSAYRLKTSFLIGYTDSSGGRVAAFKAEYDALLNERHRSNLSTCETLKHECTNGHGFTVRLLGTPSEKAAGGKIHMIKKGA
ncbi:amidohydrolase [Penicillium canescens]|nr:amidohydrolase [Penicillium canescens]KAJ6159353.1 amidohydrolase [Penicillium canescens]